MCVCVCVCVCVCDLVGFSVALLLCMVASCAVTDGLRGVCGDVGKVA